jgi:hypothetical protein
MRMNAATAWLSFGLLLSAGCTSVLGMERAELDSDGGSGTGGGGTGNVLPPIVYPISACDEPLPECASCLNGRGNALDECLLSKTCRKALYDYRSCTADRCGSFNGECAQKYLAGSGAEANAVAGLLTDSCFDACLGTAVAPMCQLYCACMGQNCPGRLSDCMADCTAQASLDNVYCRWMHCEFATPDNLQHCEHATGRLGFCPRPSAGNQCDHLVYSGFPCAADAECCSGTCGGAPSGVCD